MQMGLQWFVYAFALGIGSSLHCIGMCGPLVMALPIKSNQQTLSPYINFTLYSLTKALMYGVIGLLPGLMGWSIKSLTGQWWISTMAGLAVLILTFSPVAKPFKWMPTQLLDFIQRQYQVIYSKPSWYYFVAAGGLNALLPCAMILIALTASISTASPILSFWFMFYFGLGTIPALAVVQFGKTFFLRRFQPRAGVAARFIALTLAILLMLRGAPFMHNHSMSHTEGIISTCKLPER